MADSPPPSPQQLQDLVSAEGMSSVSEPGDLINGLSHPVQESHNDNEKSGISFPPCQSSDVGRPFIRQDSTRESAFLGRADERADNPPGVIRVSTTNGSVVMQGDISPQGKSSQPYTQGDDNGHNSAMVTGFSESSEVSAECIAEAEALLDAVFNSDCKPVAISILVCNDNNQKNTRKPPRAAVHDAKSKEIPLFDADESCSVLKKELLSYGVTVIPITNRPLNYLLAVLEGLERREIPKSCKLLWFIFSGHGVANRLAMNGAHYECEDLIRKAAKIDIQCMAFFFECCQRNCDFIKAINIEKEYMTLYSAPPNKESFFKDGIGLMVRCLVEMLKNDTFKESLNELQCKLRENIMSMMFEVLPVPSHEMEDFKRKHLSLHTSAMFNMNLYKDVRDAMRPHATIGSTEDEHYAQFTVYSPSRILYHPSKSRFELHSYKFIAKLGNDSRIILGESKAEFSDSSTEHSFRVPPQVSPVDGKLIVEAVYGDGTVVCSHQEHDIKMPYFEKPSIVSYAVESNGCEVSLEFNPNIRIKENDAYQLENIDFGFFDSSKSWTSLELKKGSIYTQRCSITLPPSKHTIKRDLAIAVKYKQSAEVIYSDIKTVQQAALPKPHILSIECVNNLMGHLKFSSNRPSKHDRYRVTSFTIQYSLSENGPWTCALPNGTSHEFPEGQSLADEEGVDVLFPLLGQPKQCRYKVLLNYPNNLEVESEVYMIYLDATDVPTFEVDRKGLRDKKLIITFTHPDSYPALDSEVRNTLKYKVEPTNVSCGQQEEGPECSSNELSMEYEGGLRSSFRIKVFYNQRENLGSIETEVYKVNKCAFFLSFCWKCVPTPLKALIPLTIIFASALFCGLYFPRGIPQLIAVNQTLPLLTSGWRLWCAKVSVEENIVGFSDYPHGFNISAYELNVSALPALQEHIVIEDRYPPQTQVEFDDEEQRYLIPLNYYHDPLFLLAASVITLNCSLDMPQGADKLKYAIVNIFGSREEAVSYEEGKTSSKKQVHSIDVTSCAKRNCSLTYTVPKDSFYFFVLTTMADSEYSIITNFTFYVISYANPGFHSNALLVANISANSSQDISLSLHSSKIVLLFAHPPDDVAVYENLVHLRFTCVQRRWMLALVYTPLLFVIFVIVGVCALCAWGKKCLVKCKPRTRRMEANECQQHLQEDNPHERTPLLRPTPL